MLTLCYASLYLLLLGAPGETFEDSKAERATFLREAEVIGQETMSTGITRPQLVELRHNGVTRRAVFKGFEADFPRRVMTVGLEQQQGLRDSWKFEVAAYELDQLLGLGMVPVTVVREVAGHEGALMDFVEDILPDFETSPDGFSLDDWQKQVEAVWFFDYLAYNIDRTPENLLVTKGFKIRLIDHTRAFQSFLRPMRPLSRFPQLAIDRLRTLEEDDFEEALGSYLDGDEMEALLERRKRLLEHVDRLLEEHPKEDVFFSSSEGEQP